LTDLAFIEIGNSDFMQGTSLVNMEKRRKVAQVISGIKNYQEKPFGFVKVQPLQDFFLQHLDSMIASTTEQSLLDKSYQLEPPVQEVDS
jgi:hypothetical protein